MLEIGHAKGNVENPVSILSLVRICFAAKCTLGHRANTNRSRIVRSTHQLSSFDACAGIWSRLIVQATLIRRHHKQTRQPREMIIFERREGQCLQGLSNCIAYLPCKLHITVSGDRYQKDLEKFIIGGGSRVLPQPKKYMVI